MSIFPRVRCLATYYIIKPPQNLDWAICFDHCDQHRDGSFLPFRSVPHHPHHHSRRGLSHCCVFGNNCAAAVGRDGTKYISVGNMTKIDVKEFLYKTNGIVYAAELGCELLYTSGRVAYCLRQSNTHPPTLQRWTMCAAGCCSTGRLDTYHTVSMGYVPTAMPCSSGGGGGASTSINLLSEDEEFPVLHGVLVLFQVNVVKGFSRLNKYIYLYRSTTVTVTPRRHSHTGTSGRARGMEWW